jgi:hypothetical protein
MLENGEGYTSYENIYIFDFNEQYEYDNYMIGSLQIVNIEKIGVCQT